MTLIDRFFHVNRYSDQRIIGNWSPYLFGSFVCKRPKACRRNINTGVLSFLSWSPALAGHHPIIIIPPNAWNAASPWIASQSYTRRRRRCILRRGSSRRVGRWRGLRFSALVFWFRKPWLPCRRDPGNSRRRGCRLICSRSSCRLNRAPQNRLPQTDRWPVSG